MIAIIVQFLLKGCSIHDKKIVIELLQNQSTYQNIIKNINHIIKKDNYKKIQNDYLECISSLNQEKVLFMKN